MASGKNNQQTASELGVHRETVMFWRARWLDAAERCSSRNSTRGDQELLAMIEEAIKDELRITPVTFSAEQVTQIIALACSEPGFRTTNQSLECQEIAAEAIKRGLSKQFRPAR